MGGRAIEMSVAILPDTLVEGTEDVATAAPAPIFSDEADRVRAPAVALVILEGDKEAR
jgi:hypothetical protein